MAEWTGLEPATTGVTGRYSNQLNYHSEFENLSVINLPNPLDFQFIRILVGAEGIEPPTSAL